MWPEHKRARDLVGSKQARVARACILYLIGSLRYWTSVFCRLICQMRRDQLEPLLHQRGGLLLLSKVCAADSHGGSRVRGAA
jgi:hypothetical protein